MRDEQKDTDKLERMVGGPERAFRLMRLRRRADQAASGDRFTLQKSMPSAEELFAKWAAEEGYSQKAIRFYLSGAFD